MQLREREREKNATFSMNEWVNEKKQEAQKQSPPNKIEEVKKNYNHKNLQQTWNISTRESNERI